MSETRIAPDGGEYTRDEFIEFYGGTKEWDAAGDEEEDDDGEDEDGTVERSSDVSSSEASESSSAASGTKDSRSSKASSTGSKSDSASRATSSTDHLRTKHQRLLRVNLNRTPPQPNLAQRPQLHRLQPQKCGSPAKSQALKRKLTLLSLRKRC